MIRTPLIPEVTDTEENITDIATVLKENGINYIEVLPYNKMAGAKYKMVMREFTRGFDERIEVNPHTEIFKDFGINVKIMQKERRIMTTRIEALPKILKKKVYKNCTNYNKYKKYRCSKK